MPTIESTYRVPYTNRTDQWGGCSGNSSSVSSGSFTVTGSVTKPDSRPRRRYLELCRAHVYRGTSMNGTLSGVEFSPMSVTTSVKDLQCDLPGGRVRTSQASGYRLVINASEEPNDPTTLDLTMADNQARTRFNDSLRQARTSLQTFVTAGEAGETLRMIQDRGRKLARRSEDAVDRYYYRMMRDRFLRRLPLGKRIAKAIDTASGMWLEEVFGWGPLVSDLDSGAKTLARILHEDQTRYSIVKGFGEHELQVSIGNWKSFTSGNNSVQYRVQRTGFTSVRYVGEIQVQPASRAIHRTLGVSLRDIVPSIYELVPYSFLLDYFVNLGDVINGWANWADELIWCERGQYREYSSQVVGVSWYLTPTNLISRRLSPGTVRKYRSDFNRSRFNYAATLVRLQFRIPGIGSTKWANMAALTAKTQRCRTALRGLLT